MKTRRRLFDRPSAIKRTYGDVALAAVMLCFAVAVHGAFVLVPSQEAGGASQADGAANVAIGSDEQGAPALAAESDHAMPSATDHHDIDLAVASAQPASLSTNPAAGAVPIASSSVPQRERANQSPTTPIVAQVQPPIKPASKVEPADAERDQSDVLASIASINTGAMMPRAGGGLAVSALLADNSGSITPFAISALDSNDTNLRAVSAPPSAKITISALEQ